MTVKDYVITVTAKEALPAGIRQFTMVATFNGNPTAAGSMSAHLGHVVNTLRPERLPQPCCCQGSMRFPTKGAGSLRSA